MARDRAIAELSSQRCQKVSIYRLMWLDTAVFASPPYL